MQPAQTVAKRAKCLSNQKKADQSTVGHATRNTRQQETEGKLAFEGN